MANTLDLIKKDIAVSADPIRAKHSLRFFRTGPGEYGEGDVFLGLTVPSVREVVKKYKDLSLNDIVGLLHSKFHEERLVALLILVGQFRKGNEKKRKALYTAYLDNTTYINNWDLVDVTAPKIVGWYLEDKDKGILTKLAQSTNLWDRRIAILATFWFTAQGHPEETLKIAEILLKDKHDLIHKASGWALREVGKRCGEKTEEQFLKKYAPVMPRTMLRYAIERFSDEKRRYYLSIKHRR